MKEESKKVGLSGINLVAAIGAAGSLATAAHQYQRAEQAEQAAISHHSSLVERIEREEERLSLKSIAVQMLDADRGRMERENTLWERKLRMSRTCFAVEGMMAKLATPAMKKSSKALSPPAFFKNQCSKSTAQYFKTEVNDGTTNPKLQATSPSMQSESEVSGEMEGFFEKYIKIVAKELPVIYIHYQKNDKSSEKFAISLQTKLIQKKYTIRLLEGLDAQILPKENEIRYVYESQQEKANAVINLLNKEDVTKKDDRFVLERAMGRYKFMVEPNIIEIWIRRSN